MMIRDLSDVTAILAEYERPTTVGEYTLDAIFALLEFLGKPQDQIRMVHVAGTSGKTSTSYFAASLLHQAGYRVGLSVSPHIDSVRERTQIGMELIPEDEYVALFAEYISLVRESQIVPSYFELMVAFSYWVFAKKRLDYVVIEVGLGGLLDATNVSSRLDKVCVITDIGYDHMNILGNTIEEIAAQKAGIIELDSSVFMHHQDAAIENVVLETVRKKGASVYFADDTFESDFLPLFQKRNFGLALAAVNSFAEIDGDAIERALHVYIPARMEQIKVGDKTVILDGAHNEQKIHTLVLSLKQRYPHTKMTIVAAFNGNRKESMEDGIAILKDIAGEVVATGFESHQDAMHQSLDPQLVANEAKRVGIDVVKVINSPVGAIAAALSKDNPYILVVGSFYLLQYVRPVLLTK